MADAIFKTAQQRLLGLLFGQPERSFFVTELIGLANIGRGAVQRELSRLEKSGLVLTERHGNQKHFRANPDAPIYEELCAIIRKTLGVQEHVRSALEPLQSRISLALIYGSVAKHTDSADSDIDLLVVSNHLTLEEVYAQLSDTEMRLGRRISPMLYSAQEFRERRADGSAFLKRVLEAPVTLIQGTLSAT